MRFEAWLLAQSDLGGDQERWLRMIGEQIKANAGTSDRFELHRFVDPPFSYRGGLDRALGVFGGMDKLETLLDDLNANVFKDGATRSDPDEARALRQ